MKYSFFDWLAILGFAKRLIDGGLSVDVGSSLMYTDEM